jgi:hypothetical protein
MENIIPKKFTFYKRGVGANNPYRGYKGAWGYIGGIITSFGTTLLLENFIFENFDFCHFQNLRNLLKQTPPYP